MSNIRQADAGTSTCRQKNAPFKKFEELMNVKGIGEKSFLKLKPLITVTVDKAERGGDK